MPKMHISNLEVLMEFVGVFLVFLSVLSVVVWRWDYSSCSFVGLGITPTFDKEFIINDAFAKMPHFCP